MMGKKIQYHTFIPSKEEEEKIHKSSHASQFQPAKELVEAQDWHPPSPIIDSHNPWQIRRTLTHHEVVFRRIFVPFEYTVEHVFRYWVTEEVNDVVCGRSMGVDLWDVTDHKFRTRHSNKNTTYFQISAGGMSSPPDQNYCLVCWDLFRGRSLKMGDEFGLYWNPRSHAFYFKLFSRQFIIER